MSSSSSAYLAVHAEGRTPGARAAVRVHGVYDTMTEARDAVRVLVSENPETDAYIVDETDRWIAVRPPATGTAEEDEEIASKCNDAPSDGRMGSVCDIGVRPNANAASAANAGSSAAAADAETEAAATTIIPPAARKEAGTVQQRQLDELLRDGAPSDVSSAEAYANARARFATLTAFRRKLAELHGAGEALHARTSEEIAALDARHPQHRSAFRAHYERGLRESGFSVESVPFLAYL